MRTLYYALGGGLGHLVRARAFLAAHGLLSQARVLTASDFARDSRVAAGLEILPVPKALQTEPVQFRSWLLQELARVRADCLCIDTFPAGILGELHDLDAGRPLLLWHVARLLRWPDYAKQIAEAPLRFARCFRTEPLTPAHDAFLAAHCDSIAELRLHPTSPIQSATCPEAEPYWLIVHSGPATEVSELVAFAHETRTAEAASCPLWLITQSPPAILPPGTRVLDAFPAHGYFADAQRIFTAAGFNIMGETAPYRHKHRVLPMPRRFDDQFERSRRAFAR